MKGRVFVQPVTLSYGGESSAWYGEMTLLPHLWKTFCRPSVRVDVIFHEAKPASLFENRKEVCDWAYRQSSEGLKRLRAALGKQEQHEETIFNI